MNEPWTGVEILVALETGARELEAYFSSIPDEAFFDGDDAAWSPAHHLSHVTRSNLLVTRGLKAGSALPAHASGRSRTHGGILAVYRTGLVAARETLKRTNPVPPTVETGATRDRLVAEYANAARGLREASAAWSEADLDARAMRHPLLGMVSTREMLLFILIHDRHHLDGVREALASR